MKDAAVKGVASLTETSKKFDEDLKVDCFLVAALWQMFKLTIFLLV